MPHRDHGVLVAVLAHDLGEADDLSVEREAAVDVRDRQIDVRDPCQVGHGLIHA
jgi:hypothetical protein